MDPTAVTPSRGLIDKLPAPLNAALALAFGYLAAVLTWQLLPAPEISGAAPVRPTVTANAPSRRNEAPGERIAEQHLFGEEAARQPVQTAVARPTEAPDTRLNLKLLGVLAATPADSAMAIIADGRNQEDVYAVGDTLPGEATLEEVFADRVLLRRADRLETLRLPESSPTLDDQPRAQASSNRGGPIVAPNVLSDGTSVRDLRDQIVQNPLSFARRVATIPVRENGRLVGYRLRARDGSDTLQELGVQPDDVITEVNGFKLDTRRGGMQALRDLRTAQSINLTLRRNGAEIPVSLSLQ